MRPTIRPSTPATSFSDRGRRTTPTSPWYATGSSAWTPPGESRRNVRDHGVKRSPTSEPLACDQGSAELSRRSVGPPNGRTRVRFANSQVTFPRVVVDRNLENVNWESVFYLNAPIGVIALLVSAAVLPRSRNSTGHHRFDVPGVVLLALGLLCVVFGVVKGETWGWVSAGTVGAVSAGVFILVGFGWYENRIAHPLLPMRLFRNRALTVGTIITALNFFVMLGVIFFVMLYLQNVRGFSPVEAGVRTLPLSLASLVASPLGAALTGRFGPRLSMPLGMLLQAAATFGLLSWDTGSSYATMWPPFIALGLGVGMVLSASSDAIVGQVPVKDGGVAGGLQGTALQIGGALGTSVLVSLISSRVDSTLVDELTGAGVPASVAGGLEQAGDAVAMGVAPVSGNMTEQLRAAVVEGSGQAFMNGVHTAVTVTGVLCLLGAALAAAGLRGTSPAAAQH
ncbi:MFS transporter [Streptomyces sp. NPDC059153]|uniref:MFS transporter n=1 Tax=Streptomyces sp. NPDC059153 TaxID=3346743 RepID=UPI0036CF6795